MKYLIALIMVFFVNLFPASPPYGPSYNWVTCEYGKTYTFITDSTSYDIRSVDIDDFGDIASRLGYTWLGEHDKKVGITIKFPLYINHNSDTIFNGKDHTLSIGITNNDVSSIYTWTFHTVKYVSPNKAELKPMTNIKQTYINKCSYDVLGRKILTNQSSGRFLSKNNIITKVK